MTLKEFIDGPKVALDAFGPYIEDLNKKYPENKAEDLGYADWFEQFEMFLENR